MAREYEPVVGQWYENIDENESFRVLSMDEDAELVEIEYLDGDIEEIDLETWHELDLEKIDEPEGWAGSPEDEEEEEEEEEEERKRTTDLDETWDDDEDDEDDEDWDENEKKATTMTAAPRGAHAASSRAAAARPALGELRQRHWIVCH